MVELSKRAENLLSHEQKELIRDGFVLLGRFASKDGSDLQLSDYSFLVAPFAKAYEGFLKLAFLRMGIIRNEDYYSDHFRVGKVLNPSLRYKKFSVYRRLEGFGDEGALLAETLWRAWKKGRNLVFHYFPHNLRRLTIKQARKRIEEIIRAINSLSLFLDKF